MPRHAVIKMANIKDKERIKKEQEKGKVSYKGNHISLSADLSPEMLQARREWHEIKLVTGKNLQTSILYILIVGALTCPYINR